MSHAAKLLVLMSLCALTAACGKPDNPHDRPVSHWLNDTDACARASAAAIIKAGLPFPNYGTEPVAGAASGSQPARHIKTVDVWLGGTRLVLPAELVYDSGGYAQHDPRRFSGLRGTLPNFYPVGSAAPVTDGMGPMVDVNFKCSMDEAFAKAKGYQSKEEWIEKVKTQYEKELRVLPDYPGDVTVSRREDIGMIEVFMQRRGQQSGEASYWPIDAELKSPDGFVSAIGCARRHDPHGARYGGVGWRCGSGIRIAPHAGAQIDIYVSHIEHMPAVYAQVKQLLLNAQQPVKE
jgi:hypothetical protein